MIKKIVILKPKKSLNFSESCNVGIIQSKSEFIFIANDDIIISKNTIENLKKNTNDEVITGPDSNCNLGFQTDYAYTVKNVRLVPAMSLPQVEKIIPDIYNINVTRNEIIQRSWLAFFATMFTRKCFNDVGTMDETFVYDREDLDWCLRASAKGKKFHQVFSSYAFHFGGVSRKVKHQELGLKHDLDNEHNLLYYNKKYGIKQKPIIAFYCYDAWEYWDEKSLNASADPSKPAGIGGSETQVIILAKEFSKLGYKVKVFNKCKENHFDSDGDIEYIPFQNFKEYSKKVKYDYLIAERYLNCFDEYFEADRCFAMIHDVFLIMQGRNPHDVKKDRIEKYFCLSNSHKDYVRQYHNIPEDKLLMTSNGLDFDRFKDIDESKRDPYKMVFSSSPDRGLEVLLPIYDRIKERVPQANLHIFYGFENFRDKNYVEKILSEIKKRPGITYHGRVGQDRLAEEFKTSGILGYSSIFEETYCCLPDTKITTEKGLIKIKELEEGTKVLTHKHNFKKASKILSKNISENIFKIKTAYLPNPLMVTREHPLLTFKKSDKKTDWHHAYSLAPKDYLTYPINKNNLLPDLFSCHTKSDLVEDNVLNLRTKSTKIKDFTIDKDFLMLCGWFISEGCFDEKSIISFSLNIKEELEASFIKAQLDRLGLTYREDIKEKEKVRRIVASSVVLGRFFTDNFGSGAKNKRIPQWVKNLDTDYLKYFLKGIIQGDGCKDKNTLRLECASEALIYDLFDCLLKLGCISSVTNTFKSKIKKEEGKIVRDTLSPKTPAFCIVCSMSQNKEFFEFIGYPVKEYKSLKRMAFFDENYVYLPIRSITPESYEGEVYNLEVEEDASYVTNNVISHNCITALEAMAGGSVIISSDYWGLKDTVKEGGILLPMPNKSVAFTPEYQDAYVEHAIKVMTDETYRKYWQQKGYERVSRFEWSDVALQWHNYFRTGVWKEIQ